MYGKIFPGPLNNFILMENLVRFIMFTNFRSSKTRTDKFCFKWLNFFTLRGDLTDKSPRYKFSNRCRKFTLIRFYLSGGPQSLYQINARQREISMSLLRICTFDGDTLNSLVRAWNTVFLWNFANQWFLYFTFSMKAEFD